MKVTSQRWSPICVTPRRLLLSVYVVGVLIVLVIVNGPHRSRDVFSGGFLVEMLAMYIAVHVYAYERSTH
jgi:hypothetical protein